MRTAFESIKQGLTEAIEFAQGKPTQAVVHTFSSVDVKAVRVQVGMSQTEFASAFGISLGTLRHWERGDRKPRGSGARLVKYRCKRATSCFTSPFITSINGVRRSEELTLCFNGRKGRAQPKLEEIATNFSARPFRP